MGNPLKIALLAAALLAGPMAVSHSAKADHVAVSIGGGGIAFGYTDGYWDRAHHWHRWRNRHEAAAWRAENADHYYAQRHDHDHGDGWRDENWWDHH
jgi:hypothetical protein